MTRQPKPAPKQPRPITNDPFADDLQVVVSFRADTPRYNISRFRAHLEGFLLERFASIGDLDIAIRVIGAAGERVEDEGRWDAPPPFDPDPELIDHLEGNKRERRRYRAEVEAMREGPVPSANLDEVEFGDPRPINNIKAKGKRL